MTFSTRLFYILIAIFCCTAPTHAQPLFRWADAMHGFSTNSIPSQTGAGQLFADRKGNVYVLNNISRGIDMDPGPGVDSVYTTQGGGTALGKYDSTGKLIWAHTLGNALATSCTISDSGYYYIAGEAIGTDSFGLGYTIDTSTVTGFFVAKYDSFDHLVWVRVTAAPGGDVYSIKTDHAGNVYFTGQFNGTTDFDPAHPGNYVFVPSLLDGFVAKYSAGGQFIWARQFNGSDGDRGVALDLDAAANVVVTGYTGGSATPYTPMMDTGGVFRILYNNGGYDAFVIKYNTNGAILWMKAIGGSSHDYGYALMVDKLGNVYAGGYYTGSMIADSLTNDTLAAAGANDGAFFIKYSPNGNFLWAKNYGCDSGTGMYANVWSIAKDDTDNVYLAGVFMGKIQLNPAGPALQAKGGVIGTGQDGFILKLDSIGNYKWSQHIYSKRDDVPGNIFVDAHNSIYVSGYITDTTNFNLNGSGGLIGYPMPNLNWIPVSFVEKFTQSIHSDSASGINIIPQAHISLFPNPVHNSLTLTGHVNTTGTIWVIDALGRKYNLPIIYTTNSATINTQALLPGIYFIKYQDAECIYPTQKFIKE
jgi:hypothetical protein